MAKIGSFYKDSIYIITQSPHCGLAQACLAMDFGWSGYADKNLYAPYDMTFKRKWNDGVEYWLKDVKNTYVQFVHVKPVNDYNKGKGIHFGNFINDHAHIAINVEGKWQVYLDYADRSAELFFWTYGQHHVKWTNWNTYTDRQLPLLFDSTEMVTLQQPITIQVIGTPLNIREQPNTNSKVVGTINEQVTLLTKVVASGTEVNGNKTWYLISYSSVNGYISGNFVKEIQQVADCSECEQKLSVATALLAEEQNKYIKLATDVKAFTGSIDTSKETYSKLLNVPIP